MLNAFVPVLFAASVTCTVNDAVPAVVGVPEITPVDATRLNPAGNVPALTLQLYGVVPPLACSVVEYAVPAVPPGSDVVVTVGGCAAAATAILNAFVPVLFAASVTCTVNDASPPWSASPRSRPSMPPDLILLAAFPHSRSSCMASFHRSPAALLNTPCPPSRQAVTSS